MGSKKFITNWDFFCYKKGFTTNWDFSYYKLGTFSDYYKIGLFYRMGFYSLLQLNIKDFVPLLDYRIWFSGKDCPGNDIKTLQTTSHTVCRKMCDITSKCIGFLKTSVNYRQTDCTLKTKCSDLRTDRTKTFWGP